MKKQFLAFAIILLFLSSCGDKGTDNNNSNNDASDILITFPLEDSSLMDTVLIRCDSINELEFNKISLWVNGDSITETSIQPFILPWITTNFENTSHSLFLRAYDHSGN